MESSERTGKWIFFSTLTVCVTILIIYSIFYRYEVISAVFGGERGIYRIDKLTGNADWYMATTRYKVTHFEVKKEQNKKPVIPEDWLPEH